MTWPKHPRSPKPKAKPPRPGHHLHKPKPGSRGRHHLHVADRKSPKA